MVQPTGTSSYDPVTAEPRAATNPVPDPPPPRRSRGATVRKWWARFVVLVLLAAAVLLFFRVSVNRAAQAARIDLETVTLTAQTIPIETPRSGQVTAVSVNPQQRVAKGDKVGTVEITTTDSEGEPVVKKLDLTSPLDGIVVDQPVTVGSTLQPGQPFVELYDPTKMIFETALDLENLPELSVGMSADLEADGLDRTVHATVQRIVPRVGPGDGTEDLDTLPVVLVPTRAEEVNGLVPGLRFTGTIDTRTGPGRQRLITMAR
jgi:multidrug resistance efflux pump